LAAGIAARASADGTDTPANTVTSLSVTPGSGKAEVSVAIDGTVTVLDFTLENPRRIVVDLQGATLGMPLGLYDKISRGGITNVRVAQYKAGTVRVVLDLDGPHEYTVVRTEHDVKISVDGPSAFNAWYLGKAKNVVTSVAVNSPDAAPASAIPAAAAPEPAAPAAPMKKAAAAPAPEPQQSTEPRITVTFVDEHIRDVITAFSAFSHRTIVVGKSVDGFVTAVIIDKPWDIALRSVLQSQGFTAIEDSTGIITVDSYQNLADREKVEPMQTKVIAVNYAKSADMATTVQNLLKAGCGGGAAGGGAAAAAAAGGGGGGGGGAAICSTRGAVTSDEKTNTIIVTETPTRLADIESYVRDLDVRTPQVSIKAKIISVDRTGTEQLGLAYDLGSANGFSNALVTRFTDAAQTTPVAGDYRVNLGGDALAGVANASRPYKASAALQLIYNMTLGGFNLTSFIDALSSQNLTDIQAEPSITTVDNREATLFAGQTQAFLLTPPVIAGQIQSVAPQISRQDVGITLRVTPHVTANRQIQLTVFVESQTLLSVTIAGPNTTKNNNTAQVLVADGETAVLSGLTQTQVTKDKSGIPFLMSLPGIGKFFSQTSTIERKQDLLMLITPHIVDEGEIVRTAPSRP
jgi:type IV pilus assembly protein PilQ